MSMDSDRNAYAFYGEPKTNLEFFQSRVAGFASKADELEERVNEVTRFYKCKKKGVAKGKAAANGCRGKDVDDLKNGSCCGKRMQDLMRQMGTILRQISQHKWAWPFVEPVDVEGLKLYDYYEIIKKPMDLGTIRDKMDDKDGSHYKNVREIYNDIKLVFTNAMTYNDADNDCHMMAKVLLGKFEEKWRQLLPKVVKEEAKHQTKSSHATNTLISQEAHTVKMAKDTSRKLNELSEHLEELREMVVRNCRKMTTEDKRRIANGLSRLPPEDIHRAIDIIRQDSNLRITEDFNIDIDAQSESTLWRLKFFIKEKLEMEAKQFSEMSSQKNIKRKKICNKPPKTAKRQSIKH